MAAVNRILGAAVVRCSGIKKRTNEREAENLKGELNHGRSIGEGGNSNFSALPFALLPTPQSSEADEMRDDGFAHGFRT